MKIDTATLLEQENTLFCILVKLWQSCKGEDSSDLFYPKDQKFFSNKTVK